jgi:hypothetical protein
MILMYMDESGKNIITQPDQQIFIFGGLIIKQDHVFDALLKFKTIYQKYRTDLRFYLNQNISGTDKGDRIQKMLTNFEFHAVQLFNPKKNITRKGKVIKENPWQYYPDTKRFTLVNDLFYQMLPYIDQLIMFKVEKPSFISYCKKSGLVPKDELVDSLMVDFIIAEYNKWLKDKGLKGVIVPDRLDSKIRDKFVQKIKSYASPTLWTEPVCVESYFNAFTQIIDLITYCYYIVYTQAKTKSNYNAVEKVYNRTIKNLILEKDLIQYLEEKSFSKV